jgi:PAS domain S-box-containing protein
MAVSTDDVVSREQRDASRLAAIVDSTDDAIISKDLNSTITSWNPAATRMFGYSAEEMIGKSVRLLIPEDRQHEEDVVLNRITHGQRLDHYETIRRKKDGTLFPVSLTVSPILDARGVVLGASKIARDITERAKADEERRRLLEVARQANQIKDEFLATLSHELRTPLNAILGYAKLLQVHVLDAAKQASAVDAIVRNSSSLAQMIEDVLDVSRIVSGKVRLNIAPVDLAVVTREAIETAQPAADARGVRLDAHLDNGEHMVSLDADRMRQVIWNLCSNAIKFSERGSRVRVELHSGGTSIDLRVIDHGIGISPEFLPHVFERFRQADSGIKREHGGLGLGLAICRHLVELQGGQITAHSDGIGKGSTFRVTLPLSGATHANNATGRAEASVSGRTTFTQGEDLNGVTVLVVDDDPDSLALAREILKSAGATVLTASSGRDALDMLHRTRVDALITDVGMPKMDGFELIGAIRNSAELRVRQVASAALTAFARSEDRARAMQSGFDMHLSKPIDPAELIAAASALARRRT